MDAWYIKYVEACKSAVKNESLFKTFKQNRDYQYVLEHLNETNGVQYANEIARLSIEHKVQLNWTRILRNDTLGRPTKFLYQITGYGKMKISPTTLRYVCLGMKALAHMKNKHMRFVNLIEVGGGYGGQCYMFHCLAEAYQIEILNYTIFDLPEVLTLQQKYLSRLFCRGNELHHIHFLNPWQKHMTWHDSAFLFSSYALAELSPKNRALYYSLLRGHVQHGYVIWNSSDSPEDNFYHMANGKTHVEWQEEKPKTFHWNKVLVF